MYWSVALLRHSPERDDVREQVWHKDYRRAHRAARLTSPLTRYIAIPGGTATTGSGMQPNKDPCHNIEGSQATEVTQMLCAINCLRLTRHNPPPRYCC